MKKLVIAVDVDDVLAISVPAFLEFSNKTWGTNLTIEDYTEHWGSMWEASEEEWNKRAVFIHDSDFHGSLQAIEAAESVLRHLAQRFDLVITTSRRSSIKDKTSVWIDTYFNGLFKEVHFAGMWDEISDASYFATKADLCKQIGADFLIDDQPKHCIAAAEIGLQTLLFGDYPWNREYKPTSGVTRVHNWNEVKDFFDGIV